MIPSRFDNRRRQYYNYDSTEQVESLSFEEVSGIAKYGWKHNSYVALKAAFEFLQSYDFVEKVLDTITADKTIVPDRYDEIGSKAELLNAIELTFNSDEFFASAEFQCLENNSVTLYISHVFTFLSPEIQLLAKFGFGRNGKIYSEKVSINNQVE